MIKTALTLLLISSSVWGYSDAFHELVPHTETIPEMGMSSIDKSTANLTPLPGILSKRLQRFHQLAPVTCEDTQTEAYLISLHQSGEFRRCADYARACATKESRFALGAVAQGASCFSTLNEHENALKLFERGLQLDEFHERPTGFVMEFALFTQFSIYPDRTNDVIASHPTWSEQERLLAKGLVNFLGDATIEGVTKDQIKAFLQQQIATASGAYLGQLRLYEIQLNVGEYNYDRAAELLVRYGDILPTAVALWDVGFNILYRISNTGRFPLADNFYRAFLPYAHARSNLPVEQNIYTYSQLEDSLCKDNLMDKTERKNFYQQVRKWRSGELSFAKFEDFVKKQIHDRATSDRLAAYGSLLSIKGDYKQARELYWKSHNSCIYNNRAHWGLKLIGRHEKYRSYPEFRANEERVQNVTRAQKFPADLEHYIVNWRALPEYSQRFVKYGLLPYVKYIPALLKSGAKTYIKLPFELLSDTPDNANLRDRRIGPPDMQSYRFDNRLWDDVRGSGGQTVIADHDETLQSPHGAFNLMTHEVAHQFHQYLKSNASSLGNCIEKLYEAAKKRDNFPDSYSKTNSLEYFAQGMTYNAIPTDSPARYGLNRSWLPKNDPDLLSFMQSIDKAAGDLRLVSCPI